MAQNGPFHNLRIYPYPMVWPLPRPWSETMVSIPLWTQKTLQIKDFGGLERPFLDLVSQTPRPRDRGRPLFADRWGPLFWPPKSPEKFMFVCLFCVLPQEEMRHIPFFLGGGPTSGGFGWGPKSLCRQSLCAFSVPYLCRVHCSPGSFRSLWRPNPYPQIQQCH